MTDFEDDAASVMKDCFVAGRVGMDGTEMIRESRFACILLLRGSAISFTGFLLNVFAEESDSCGGNSSLSTHFSFRVENNFEREMKYFLFATKAVDF